MMIEGDARRVSIYLGSRDTWHGQNLAAAIVERCRSMGLAGATLTRGIDGRDQIARKPIQGTQMHHPWIAEPVDASRGSDPEVPFTVLRQGIDHVTRKPVAACEPFQPAMTQAQQTLTDGAHPDVAIMVSQRDFRDH